MFTPFYGQICILLKKREASFSFHKNALFPFQEQLLKGIWGLLVQDICTGEKCTCTKMTLKKTD